MSKDKNTIKAMFELRQLEVVRTLFFNMGVEYPIDTQLESYETFLRHYKDAGVSEGQLNNERWALKIMTQAIASDPDVYDEVVSNFDEDNDQIYLSHHPKLTFGVLQMYQAMVVQAFDYVVRRNKIDKKL